MSAALIQPQQKRSEDSLRRILQAARDRIARGSFESASVADIVKGANLSVGAFYARFKDKSALFHTLQIMIFDELEEQIVNKIERFKKTREAHNKDTTIDDVAKFSIDTLIALYSENAGILRAIYSHSLHKQDPGLNQRFRDFNNRTIGKSLELLECLDGFAMSKKAKETWFMSISIVGTFLREFILHGDPVILEKPLHLRKARQTSIATLSNYIAEQLN